MKKLSILFLPFATLFLACEPKPIGGGLDKTNWVLTSILYNNQVNAILKDTKITASFAGEKVSGNATCNTYAGVVSPKGSALSITDVLSTEKACDGLEQENLYLSLLGQAQSYSVFKDKLEIVCNRGKLIFAPMSGEEALSIRNGDASVKLESMFPALEGDLMPHLYPILKVDNPGTYPFKGLLVDTTFYQFFDAESDNIWSNTGGEVFAVGKYGDFYICRVPGRYVSSDIALFRKDDGVLTRSETVAWAWSDEGWTNQQDAWLLDVNKDDLTDLVQRYTLKDDKGKLREERMTVLVQDANGSFAEDKTLKADKSKFVQAKI